MSPVAFKIFSFYMKETSRYVVFSCYDFNIMLYDLVYFTNFFPQASSRNWPNTGQQLILSKIICKLKKKSKN